MGIDLGLSRDKRFPFFEVRPSLNQCCEGIYVGDCSDLFVGDDALFVDDERGGDGQDVICSIDFVISVQ